MKRYSLIAAALLVCSLFSPTLSAHAQTERAVVRAVLFYSPTCGHCEYVIQGTLIPMIDQYGDRLQIVGLDVTTRQGQAFFQSTMQKFDIEQTGVPFLLIDDMYLIGSVDIPERFPGLVETYLAQGGVDWPDIPGLAEALTETEPTSAPVVRAVLFQRSTCSHCRKVTEEVIPPLLDKYGTRLEIFGIDMSLQEGETLYHASIDRFEIERFGVPTLILGDHVLVGGIEIQEQVDSLIEGYLSQGGVDWPDISGLDEAIIRASEAGADPTHSETLHSTPSPTAAPGIPVMENGPSSWLDTFGRDPYGNTLSVIVLLGMLAAVVWVASLFKNIRGSSRQAYRGWIIPILCVLGFGVAGYLAYVETTQATAVCGPVGDCNTVQQSEYARLFGILPIGVLGLIGYTFLFVSWLVARYAREHLAQPATILLFGMTVAGTLFSIYLTFLEPFVIGATCAWCLTSAVLMTLLMLLSAGPAKSALVRKL